MKTLGSAAGGGVVVLTGGDLDQVLGLLHVRELERLARLSQPHKVYVHINNANPILDRDFSRYREGKRAAKLRRKDGNSGCGGRSRLSRFDRSRTCLTAGEDWGGTLSPPAPLPPADA